jgi:hypothetical protein
MKRLFFARHRGGVRVDSAMRIALLLILPSTIFCSTLASRAADPVAASPTPADSRNSEYAPIAFLAGATWRGQLPPGPGGQKVEIEMKADWAPNKHGIRFDSFYVVDGKKSPYTSGLYAWNAARKQLVCVYSDVEDGFIEGNVTIEQGALVHNLTVTERNGLESKVRARIIPEGQKAYLSEIFLLKEGNRWEKFVTVHYERID